MQSVSERVQHASQLLKRLFKTLESRLLSSKTAKMETLRERQHIPYPTSHGSPHAKVQSNIHYKDEELNIWTELVFSILKWSLHNFSMCILYTHWFCNNIIIIHFVPSCLHVYRTERLVILEQDFKFTLCIILSFF